MMKAAVDSVSTTTLQPLTSALCLSERFTDELLRVGRVEEAVCVDYLRGNLFAALELLKRVEGDGAEARVALDRRVHLAVNDRLQRRLLAVNRDDQNVFARIHAGGLERLNRAERHLVVVRVDGRDFMAV